MVTVGELVPDFTLPNQDGNDVTLSSFRGKKVILYFYPRDNTPGCTTEALDFKQNIDAFEGLNTVVLGISKDSVKSHTNFKCKHDLPFDLLADVEIEVCKLYGVYQLKKMYGKESMGIVRSTFVIDEEGKLLEAFSKVRVKGHIDAVLDIIK